MKSLIFAIIICVLFILETLVLTNAINCCGIYASPIIFLCISLVMAVVAMGGGVLWLPSDTDKAAIPTNEPTNLPHKTRDWTAILFASNAFILLLWYGSRRFADVPIDPNMSDVFPQVLSAARWFMQGEYAYQIVTLPSYQMNNTYLPMQWLPFCLSEYVGKDPRWIPLLSWGISILALIYGLQTRLQTAISGRRVLLGLGLLLPFWAVYAFIRHNTIDYGLTLELLPASYYIWLCVGLLSGSAWVIGLALGACLLSRFSILFFIPFLVYYVVQVYGKQKARLVAGIVTGFILCVFVLPFMTHDLQLPSKIVGNYNNGTLAEWKGQAWQEAGSEPHQLARGTGMAIYFKKWFEPDLMRGIEWLKRTEILLCLLATLVVYGLYRHYGQRLANGQWLLLGGLKLYFVFFYHFILIPYPYLFLMPMSISAVLVLKATTEMEGWALTS
jgi:hypothetical protein